MQVIGHGDGDRIDMREHVFEVICSGSDVSADSQLDTLASLVAKSLVVSISDNAGKARYQLLETVRMYASEKLARAGESEPVRQRHRDWYWGHCLHHHRPHKHTNPAVRILGGLPAEGYSIRLRPEIHLTV